MPRWLLVAYQLPNRPSHVRVKIWRRLQQIGAVSSRNAVYVLPNTDQCREDVEWVRSEIVALGGDATVFAADSVGPEDADDDIVALFHRSRASAYGELKGDLDRAMARLRRKASLTPTGRQGLSRLVRTSGERLAELERLDFFGAPARQQVVETLAAVEREIAKRVERAASEKGAAAPRLHTRAFRHRRWVTRARPGVDRMASAWLIRRFVDPHATFAFLKTPAKSDVPFDMYTGAFSHQGSRCTFETIAERFGLSDPVIVRIGHIVHDLDMNDRRYTPSEAPAIGRFVGGLRTLFADDQTLLEHGVTMFEAFARSFDSPAKDTSRQPRRR